MPISQLATFTPFPLSFDLQQAMTAQAHPGDDAAASPSNRVDVGKQYLRSAKDLQDAWFKNMHSAIDRHALLGLQLPDGETFDEGMSRIIGALAAEPNANRDLIGLYRRILEDIENNGIEIRANHTPEKEMPPATHAHVHQHEHFIRIFGMQISLIDPEEGVHACSISTHMFSPLFAGAHSWSKYYREKVDLLFNDLSSYLSEAAISHHSVEKALNLGIYSALVIGAAFAGYSGVNEILHVWPVLQRKIKERDEARRTLARLNAYPPHMKSTSLVKNKLLLAREGIKRLDAEVNQTRATLVVGASGAFTGFVLIALGASKLIAESCASLDKCTTAVAKLGKVMPGLQNVAAVGAHVIGAAFVYKSSRYSAAIGRGTDVLQRSIPQPVADGEDGISETERRYFQTLKNSAVKHKGFIQAFHRMMAAFLVSSVLNIICNFIDDALYIFGKERSGANAPKDHKPIEIVMQFNVIAYALAAFIMAISSLKFFRGHPELMKMEAAQHDDKDEANGLFLAINDLMNAESGIKLRACFHEKLHGCYEACQLFLRKIELRSGVKGSAASVPRALRDVIRRAEIVGFVNDILHIKTTFLFEAVDAAGLILERVINEDRGSDLAMNEVVEQYQDRSKYMIVFQQTKSVMDTLENWKDDDPDVDIADLAARLKSALSEEIHDPEKAAGGTGDAKSIYEPIAEFILHSEKDKGNKERISFFNHMHSAVLSGMPMGDDAAGAIDETTDRRAGPVSTALEALADSPGLTLQG
jgi:hypothetical protein